jgi:hypothetical protein
MNDENETEKKPTEDQPRKLLLGRRVLRHFNVRSSIQTGAIDDSVVKTASTDDNTSVPVSQSIRQRCY